MPPVIQQLEKERNEIIKEQKDAFDRQDFEKVAQLRQGVLEIDKKLSIEKVKWNADLNQVDHSVTAEDIANVVATWTGIPVNKIRETETEKLMNMEENLHKRVIGQDNAIVAISNAIRRNRAGLKDKDRPIGSFLFLGPTGVGKTELAKALAEFLLDDENRLIRLDMSEYMEKHSVSKIIGSPPGYVGYDEGGQLTEKVRRHPYSVILLDELEKAHPDVLNILLQLMDDGRLTDAHGRVTSFKNAIIIGTSNIGTKSITEGKTKGIGFAAVEDSSRDYNQVRSMVLNEVQKLFKPEFINRLDDLIVFHKLEPDQVRQIADLMLNNLTQRLQESDMTLEVTKKVRDQLAKDGFSEMYGARPLRRLIEEKIENAISMRIINGEFKHGGRLRFYREINFSPRIAVRIFFGTHPKFTQAHGGHCSAGRVGGGPAPFGSPASFAHPVGQTGPREHHDPDRPGVPRIPGGGRSHPAACSPRLGIGRNVSQPHFFSEPGRRVGLGRRHGFVVPRRAAGLQPGGHQRGGGLCPHHRDFHMRVLFIHSTGRVFQFIAGVPHLFFDLRHPHRPAGKQHHPASDACGHICLKTPYPLPLQCFRLRPGFPLH